MKATTIDIDQMVALRDHHLTEARKIDDALTLIRSVSRMAARAQALVGKVQAKAKSTRAAVPYSSRPGKDGMTPAVRSRIQKETGTRPTDLLRKQFHAAKHKPLTREFLIEHSGIADTGPNGRPGQSRRILGLALKRLTDNKEIKNTKAGYIAVKVLPVTTPDAVSSNGATAAHP